MMALKDIARKVQRQPLVAAFLGRMGSCRRGLGGARQSPFRDMHWAVDSRRATSASTHFHAPKHYVVKVAISWCWAFDLALLMLRLPCIS